MQTTYKPLMLAAAAIVALSACGSSVAATTKTTTKPAVSASTAKAGTATTAKPGTGTTAKPGTATTAKAGTATTAKAGTATTAGKGDSGQKWAQCMRDKGVNVPDPTVDAKGNTQIQPPKEANSEKVQAAFKDCQGLLKDVPGVANASDGAVKEALVAFSACLRKQGLDVGDADLSKAAQTPGGGDQPQGAKPDTSQTGGIPMDVIAQIVPRFDPKDPKSAPAVKTCAPALSKVLGDTTQAGA
jgi:hypothetical protein